MSQDNYGKALCHRCEHRARFLEGGSRPRYECGDVGKAVCGCYMYRPVQPVVLAPREGDKRPVQAGWMISARMAAAGLLTKEMHTVTSKIKIKGKKGKFYITCWELSGDCIKESYADNKAVKKTQGRKKKPAGKAVKVRMTKDGHVIW